MQRISVHPKNPNPRNIRLAAEKLLSGSIIAYPTDTVYALGCDYSQRKTVEALYRIKSLPKNHPVTLLCADLAQAAKFAVISNASYRLLRRILPGPYTIILEATREVPTALLTKKQTVGIRIPEHEVPLSLIREIGKPLLSTSANNPDGEDLSDPDLVEENYKHGVEIILDSGMSESEPSTVISLIGDALEVIRKGRGSLEGIWAG